MSDLTEEQRTTVQAIPGERARALGGATKLAEQFKHREIDMDELNRRSKELTG